MSPTQTKALAALLACPTYEQAAKQAGVNVRTLYGFRQDPEFAGEYEKACERMLTEAASDAQKVMPEAVRTLRNIMGSDFAETPDRIRAAKILLEYGVRLTEVTDIVKRLGELEEANRTDH